MTVHTVVAAVVSCTNFEAPKSLVDCLKPGEYVTVPLPTDLSAVVTRLSLVTLPLVCAASDVSGVVNFLCQNSFDYHTQLHMTRKTTPLQSVETKGVLRTGILSRKATSAQVGLKSTLKSIASGVREATLLLAASAAARTRNVTLPPREG